MSRFAATDQDLIQKLTEIILANLSNENFGVSELAKGTGMNYFSLNRKLRSIVKKTTSQFINEIRLQRAKEILEQEDITAAEVGYRVGYSSPAYFSRCFNEHFGYPPGEIKKRGVIEPKAKGTERSYTSKKEEEITENEQEIQQPFLRKVSLKSVVIAATVIIILIVSSLYYFLPLSRLEPKDKSIAVLPFTNLSKEKDNQDFADGVTNNVLNNLVQIRKLKVVDASPIKEFSQNPLDFSRIANKLGVRFLLNGSVQKDGNRVQVTVQLIDSQLNQFIWSEVYKKELSDIFLIQSSIAKQVASELETVISPQDRIQIEKIPTRNQEAYSFYSKGRYFLNKRTLEGFKNSLTYFEKAIATDPTYALAYAGFADSYFQYTFFRDYPRPEGYVKAKEFALKALQLDNNLAEAHATLGVLLYYSEFKWEEARNELLLALQLNPNCATAHQYYAELLDILRENKEARVQIDLASSLNPTSPYIFLISSDFYYHERKFPEALVECGKVVELDSNLHNVYWRYFEIYRSQGEEQKAMEAILKVANMFDDLKPYIGKATEIYNQSGMRGFLYFWNEGTAGREGYQVEPAIVDYAKNYCLLGEKKKAMDCLEKAAALRIPGVPGINNNPDFDSVRNEPRFQALIKKMGLSAYQTSRN
ncbi:MAG: helix-turn-helix domain-containing protein [Prolixibacteraceae bacterium]